MTFPIQEFLALYAQFETHIASHNRVKPIFEDDIEPTFANFVKWLRWQNQNSRSAGGGHSGPGIGATPGNNGGHGGSATGGGHN